MCPNWRAYGSIQKYFKDEKKYDLIYNSSDSLLIWPKIVFILKAIDDVLPAYLSKDLQLKATKVLKRSRMLTAFVTISRLLGSFNFTKQDLLSFDNTKLTPKEILETCQFINLRYDKTKLIKRSYVMALLKEASEQYGIEGYDSILRRKNAFVVEEVSVKKKRKDLNEQMKLLLIPDELLTKVDEILPEQPWPTGIHVVVAKELNISIDVVSCVIRKLIRLGKRYYQHAGIVYDKNRQIVCYDTERVTKEQLQKAQLNKKTPN